jgi:hypothetical protein
MMAKRSREDIDELIKLRPVVKRNNKGKIPKGLLSLARTD